LIRFNWYFILKEDDLINSLILSFTCDNIQFVDLLIENGAQLNKITYEHLNHLFSMSVFIYLFERKQDNFV